MTVWHTRDSTLILQNSGSSLRLRKKRRQSLRISSRSEATHEQALIEISSSPISLQMTPEQPNVESLVEYAPIQEQSTDLMTGKYSPISIRNTPELGSVGFYQILQTMMKHLKYHFHLKW